MPCKFGFYTCAFVGMIDFCNNCEDGDNYEYKEKDEYTMDVFKYIKAVVFFPEFAPKVLNWKHKMRGFNGRGNPVEFTDADKKMIAAGLEKLFKKLEV